jgi:hypothetical protein
MVNELERHCGLAELETSRRGTKPKLKPAFSGGTNAVNTRPTAQSCVNIWIAVFHVTVARSLEGGYECFFAWEWSTEWSVCMERATQ